MLRFDRFDLGDAQQWSFDAGLITGTLTLQGRKQLAQLSLLNGDRVLITSQVDLVPDDEDQASTCSGSFCLEIDYDTHVGILLAIVERQFAVMIDGMTQTPIMESEVADQVHRYSDAAMSGAPIIVGRSFFTENVRDFGGVALAFDSASPQPDTPIFLTVAMVAFGGQFWWNREDPTIADHSRPLELFGPAVVAAAAAGKVAIVFDMSNEGQPFSHIRSHFEAFHAAIRAKGLSLQSCILLVQNQSLPDLYRAAWPNGMMMINYDHFVRRFAGLQATATSSQTLARRIGEHLSNLGVSRQRAFLCMNFTPRPNRIAALSYLCATGLIDKGFVSFAGFDGLKYKASVDDLPSGWTRTPQLESGVRLLHERGRMTLDLPAEGDSDVPEFDLGDPWFFDQSYCSLITESEISGPDMKRITEKILKPLAMFQPLIVLGNQHSLRRLRELGFETFSPWIDEAYDEIEDPQTRFYAALEQLHRIVDRPAADSVEWYHTISDVLVHNFIMANHLLDQSYQTVLEPLIMAKMVAQFRKRRGAR